MPKDNENEWELPLIIAGSAVGVITFIGCCLYIYYKRRHHRSTHASSPSIEMPTTPTITALQSPTAATVTPSASVSTDLPTATDTPKGSNPQIVIHASLFPPSSTDRKSEPRTPHYSMRDGQFCVDGIPIPDNKDHPRYTVTHDDVLLMDETAVDICPPGSTSSHQSRPEDLARNTGTKPDGDNSGPRF